MGGNEWLIREQLIRDDAERPHVGLGVVQLVVTQLRAQVVRRADEGRLPY